MDYKIFELGFVKGIEMNPRGILHTCTLRLS